MNRLSYEPHEIANISALEKYSEKIKDSQLVPQQYRGKPVDIELVITFGNSVGLSALQSLQAIAIIQGKPALYGDGIMAAVLASGNLEIIEESYAAGVATCRVKRKELPEQSRTFSVEDAKRAKLWGRTGPWTQYPERMLQMRARGKALRDVFADALGGAIDEYEAADIPSKQPAAQLADAAQPAADPDLDAAADRVTAAGFPDLAAPAEQDTISKVQQDQLLTVCELTGQDFEKDIQPRIMKAYNITSLAELPATKFEEVKSRIRSFGAQ